jgi:outer membrane receptor protein involved in Fe transport
VAPVAALAQPAGIVIPATTLDRALIELARQSHQDVISTEPGLVAVRTQAVAARSPAEAIAHLLQGTGYRAMQVPGGGWRIVRGAMPRPAVAVVPAKPRRVTARPPLAPASGDVIVTASKQRLSLLRYPGSLTVIGGGLAPLPNAATLTDISAHQPVLQATALGPGRDKIFIRGIADSSFNGAAESTASVYLDDLPIGYSGTDPGLRLYDMAEIDVLEGPQGTLYGSGAIGGIIRLVSSPVDLARASGAVAGGATFTAGGAPGGEVSGVVNVPLSAHVGLRVVGYRAIDGGYVDDPGRGARDVNRVDTVGGRASLLVDAGGGWQVTLAGLAQQIDGRDAQYADARVGALARRAMIAQPFAEGLRGGRVSIRKGWSSGLELVSTTGAVSSNSFERFDASMTGPPGTVTAYQTNGDKLLLSNETRLSRSLPDGHSWVVGFTLLRDRDALARSVTTRGRDVDIIGVTNRIQSASAFAEWTQPLIPGVALTLGARATAARSDGDPSAAPRGGDFVHGRLTRRFDPTLAFSWQLGAGWAAFARYQSGFRTGGLAVARGVGRVAVFESDSIRMEEVGVRHVRSGSTGLAASASVSVARWMDIQADLVNRRGQPYTLNLGDARLQTAEAALDWVPVVGLHLTGSAFFTHNTVSGPLADLSRPDNRRLPETPAVAARAGASYRWLLSGTELRAGGSVGYTGPSVLGVGDLLDVRQGGFATGELSAGAHRGRIDLAALLDNVGNGAGDRFAYGNPFILGARSERTPLRPISLSLRLGVDW